MGNVVSDAMDSVLVVGHVKGFRSVCEADGLGEALVFGVGKTGLDQMLLGLSSLLVRQRPNGGNASSQTGSGSRSWSTYRSDSGFSQSSSQTSDSTYSLSSDWGDDEDSSDWSDSSEDKVDLTQVKKGSIYYFLCEGGFYKVGMTKRDIELRLNEHRRNPDPMLRPRQHGLIKVSACDDVRLAETSILRDQNTASCRVSGTEYFREDIGRVVDRVVAAVNSRPLVNSYYMLNAANKIVRVNL